MSNVVYLRDVLPQASRVNRAHLAAAAVRHVKPIAEQARSIAPELALAAGSLAPNILAPSAATVVSSGIKALPLAGGAVLGGAIGVFQGFHDARKSTEYLRANFGQYAAETLGIPLAQVDEKALRAVASQNTYLAQAFAAIDHAKSATPTKALVSTGVGLTASAAAAMLLAGPLAIVAAPVGIAAGLGLTLASGIAAIPATFAADKALGKLDHSTKFADSAVGLIGRLSQQVAQGQEASAPDVFRIFARGNPQLAAVIAEEGGQALVNKPVEQLTPEDFQALGQLMDKHPKLRDACAVYAKMINDGSITAQSLITTDLEIAMGTKPIALSEPRTVAAAPEAQAVTPGFAAREAARRSQPQSTRLNA